MSNFLAYLYEGEAKPPTASADTSTVSEALRIASSPYRLAWEFCRVREQHIICEKNRMVARGGGAPGPETHQGGTFCSPHSKWACRR